MFVMSAVYTLLIISCRAISSHVPDGTLPDCPALCAGGGAEGCCWHDNLNKPGGYVIDEA